MKLWDKGKPMDRTIEDFTVGKDRELDGALAKYDLLGSLAHGEMLWKVGLLTEDEFRKLEGGLKDLLAEVEAGTFVIGESFEDVHSYVEWRLTEQLGDVGKKIHTSRSRNDQVLTDIKLFLKDEVTALLAQTHSLFDTLLNLSEQHKDALMPGYTHLQVAMPSSFGLWFGAYAETLIDDVHMLKAAYKVIDQNPLGSAAGYGASFPIDRELTTELMGFGTLHYNVVAAQMSRGKTERTLAFAMAGVGSTLGRMAMDVCLYMSQNFGFLTFPDHLTTGSSIMPHKKNPDVWELLRARCNELQALPNTLSLMGTNLPSGYHRDYQLLKEVLLPALVNLHDCLSIANYMLKEVIVKTGFMDDERYAYLYTVEEVNRLVQEGLPFRDAYKQVGAAVEEGTYQPNTQVKHTHLGSLGNLGTAQIRQKMEQALV